MSDLLKVRFVKKTAILPVSKSILKSFIHSSIMETLSWRLEESYSPSIEGTKSARSSSFFGVFEVVLF